MITRKNRILLWVLTWASLLLAVLYSPIGSPDLYTPANYQFVPNQGTILKNGDRIANSNQSKRGNYTDNTTPEIVVPDYNNGSKNNYAYSGSGETTYTGSGYAPLNDNTSYQGYTGTNDGPADGGFFISGGRSTNAAGSVSQNPGVFSLSTNLNLTTTTTRQLANASTSGYTDPGGDPSGDPIPVGDGWVFLSILTAGYALWKLKAIKKTNHGKSFL